MIHTFQRAVLVGGLAIAPFVSTPAQGVASAAVQGTVVSASGKPVPNARVTLTNASTGNILMMVTGDAGRYAFENVPVGGPYAIVVRAIGLAPGTVDGIVLHLGDRLTQPLVLAELQGARLAPVMVRTPVLRNAGAGGPAFEIAGDAVRNLPLLNRDFVGLLAMAPQATGPDALFIGGQNQRFNAIQVDGGSGGDFYGVNITPGSAAGARALSIEALDEIRILVAPFDVRQGGFSGGLINAVTRSGTNQFRGSAFVSLARAALVGEDTAGGRAQTFSTTQYGLSAGGPLIPNRLHLFASADLQASSTPFAGPPASDPSTGVSEATALRAQRILRERYGFDPGGPQAPVLEQPTTNLFAKLSWQPSPGHRVELTGNWSSARNDNFSRTVRTSTTNGTWELAGSGFVAAADNSTYRVKATSLLGSASNEFIASYAVENSGRHSRLSVPVFLVQGDLNGTYIAGGSVAGAQGTETDQRVFEVTDNVAWNAGPHLLTAGVQAQRLHFIDNFFSNSWGTWTFPSVDALDRNTPSQYDVALPRRAGGPLADMTVSQLALYMQDHWNVTDRLAVTVGVRADVPSFLTTPPRNPVLAADAALGTINTGRLPSGNAAISPRVGFAFDPGRNGQTLVRGGVGAFAGKPPYVWLAGAFQNTGQEQALLSCDATKGVPAVTTDVGRLPGQCLNGAAAASAISTINYVSQAFHFQQAWKFDLGVDHDFGHGLTASLEAIHTRTFNTSFVSDVNLVERGVNAEGRWMYGTISTSAAGTPITRPTRVDTAFGPVFRFDNRSADRATAVSLEAQKRWTSGAALQFGYNWSTAQDPVSISGLNTAAMAKSNPIDGSMSNRALRRSARDVPHTVVLTAIVPLPYGITSSLYFRARSGTPYAYVSNGDANADGTKGNDLAYIPRDGSDITLANPSAYAALNSFIESEPCLRRQRGRLIARNSCRNPAVQSLDVRLAKSTRLWSTRNVEVTADVFNLPNLVDPRWGLTRETTANEGIELLQVTGWDVVNNRPRYTVPSVGGLPVFPSRNHVVTDVSRWRMQLGVRYAF